MNVMKKRLSLIIVTGMSLLYGETSLAESDYQINLNLQSAVLGNYQPSYEVLTGAGGQYFFSEYDRWQPYVRGEIISQPQTSDSQLTIYNASVGSQYVFAQAWGKNIFADFSIGASYHVEEFSSQLIGRTAKTSFIDWDYQLGAGVGVQLSNQFSSKLFINQLGGQGTSVGGEVSFRF